MAEIIDGFQCVHSGVSCDLQEILLEKIRGRESHDLPLIIERLLENEKEQISLGEKIKKLALPNATKQIVDEVEKILK